MKLDDKPSPAPAAEPVALEAKEPPQNPDSPPTPVTYEPTGHSGLDMALAFVGKLGFGPEHPAMVAAGNGDFSMLKAALSTFGDKAVGWEAHVELGATGFAALKGERDAKVAKDREGILKVVGGEESWKAIQAWASENAEAEEKALVNAALSAGGIQAKAMAHYLAVSYARATGTTLEPGDVAPGAQRMPMANLNGPLSPAEYKAAIAQLRGKIGAGAMDNHPDYIKLNNRRRAWKGDAG
jgi:hypothetical protein